MLVTGHTGFKGGWLVLWLRRLGAEVAGISLPAATVPGLYGEARIAQGIRSEYCDIRDAARLAALVADIRPEIVFHLAAQPLVRASYRNPLDTFATNTLGTAHVLEALRGQSDTKVAVVVTTDKVYRNAGAAYPHRESDPLGGHDPYSASKAASEIVVASYRDAFLAQQGIAVASARAGNVIGGGDWSEDRLIPDAVRAWQAGDALHVRRPEAVRPWQHVLEPLKGYLTLAERLWRTSEASGAYNFGPWSHDAATVRRVVDLARVAYGKGQVDYGDGSEGPHESGWLALETSLAHRELGVCPRWSLETSVQRTLAWYREHHLGADARELCEADIDTFEAS